MIPIPKLDDRTYADIMAEALRLLPRYSPDWTNHNPSDPGITILELTAWMTELLLYRVNRIPEKNYVAFLNMLGIRLRGPQPARALVTFELVEGAHRQVIPEGMQIATGQAADDDGVIFETQRELVLVGARLDRAFSYHEDRFSDNSPYLVGGRQGGFSAFGGGDRIDRYLYLGDPRFDALAPGSMLHVHVAAPEHGGRDLARLLEWEYWNGRRWRDLKQTPAEVERGEVVFFAPGDLAASEVNGLTDFFIRGRLAEVPDNPWETEVDTVRAVVEVAGEGTLPDTALTNLETGGFRGLDLSKNFLPFGAQPRIDDCLYLASRELFAEPGSDVRIEIAPSNANVQAPAGPSPDLVITWEYFDGRKWRTIGKSTPTGAVHTGDNAWAFVDTTAALSKAGAVTFRVPTDIAPGEVNGEDNYWVRLRIDAGDYGQNGSYMLDGERWVWRDERPLRPPGLKSLGILYRADLGHPRRVLSFNDFLYRDHSEEAKVAFKPFQPFAAVADEGPALYLGWDRKLPNDPLSLYIQLADVGPEFAIDSVRGTREGRNGDQGSVSERPDEEWLRRWYAERDAVWEAEQRIVWEYFDAKEWVPLVVVDGTNNLTQSGFLEFVAPDDMAPIVKFTEERHFIRARLEMGGYVRGPRIERILQNSVEAANVITIREEVLGSSDGTPAQGFRFAQGPMLEGEHVEVLEREMPPAEELVELGENATRPNPYGDGVWVRWKGVDSFFDSEARSRHYTRDAVTRRISFGDGLHGLVPPPGLNGILARKYQVGGGVKGNVNAFGLSQLTRAVAYVERCYNAQPAAGGADAETIEEAKARAPMVLKSRDRAVTSEDFESLALRASTAVARARCLPSRERDGEVRVVILPRGEDKTADLTRRLSPAPELLRHVKNYLDERRLVGTIVHVEKPTYAEISLRVSILRRTIGQSDRVKREIEERLRRFLHPLVGGRDGTGWPFGRAVYKSDLAHMVEDIPGLEAVDEITIYDEDKRHAVESVRLDAGDLPLLVNIVVVERVRQEIVSTALSPTRAVVRMPDLVGMPYTKAKLIVENAGLVFAEVMFAESYEARNTVLDQAPARGQMVYAGDRVAVAISRDSYARWLPAIYQRSDLTGRNLVKELLWVTQHLFGSIEELLNIGHAFYDPYESPEKFLPWLASWTAMVLEEDWPVAKKRRLIKRAVELYRIRGTLRGLKLFISLFTGHEPDVRENEWPFRGWRVGVSSAMGIDTVILPPLNLARTFIVEMPTAYRDLSPESVVRIHEIVRMEKPAHTQYWLRFAAESDSPELREFFSIGTRSGIGIGQEILRAAEGGEPTLALPADDFLTKPGATQTMTVSITDFPSSPTRIRRPLPKAARADNAPVEGREVRSSEEGFGASAREMSAMITAGEGTAPRTAQSGAVPASPVVQPMPDDTRDTAENAVGARPHETLVSSTPARLADEMKRGDGKDKEDEGSPTKVRGPKTKPDPKKK